MLAPSWDFSKIPLYPPDRSNGRQLRPPLAAPLAPIMMQRKLQIGAVDDPLEHEADSIADTVMRMADPDFSVSSTPTQLNRQCAACEKEEAQMLQTKPADKSQASFGEAPGIVHEVLQSPGQPLDPATRTF